MAKKEVEPPEGTKADMREDVGEPKHHAKMHPAAKGKKGKKAKKGCKRADPFL
jgi:hypothetical protein